MTRIKYPSALSGPSHRILPARNARRLVIFFGAKDLLDEEYNFFQLGRELPEHRMFINNGANEWYQYGIPGLGRGFKSTLNMLKRWRNALEADDICTIGTSMGAYGAIQYGVALQARVLAFSVDSVLKAEHSRSARYFTGTKPPGCPDLRTLLSTNTPDVTLFVGERDPVDLYAAWQLAQTAPINTISLVGADHVVPTFLSRRSRMGPLLRSFVANTGIPEQPDAGNALTTKGYVAALFKAHGALKADDWKTAERHARVALKAYSHGEAAASILGQALLKLTRPDEAAIWLASSAVSQPADLKLQILLAAAFRQSGNTARARQIYYQILSQKPGYHAAHYGLGMLFFEIGALKSAYQSVEDARRLAPENETYRARLATIARCLEAAD